MTFEELIGGDKEGAYYEWVSVSTAKAIGDIPEKYWEYFDDYCECGSENMIKTNLKLMTCCDPKCKIKLGFALAELLTRFDIKGLKEATCQKIYTEFKAKDAFLKKNGEPGILLTDSYIAALAVPWNSYPTSVATSAKGIEFHNACIKILQEPITFPKLVSKLAIPSIGNNAEKMMSKIHGIDELLEKIKECGSVRGFCCSRGFYSEMVAYNLRISLMDIATADRLFSSSVRSEGVLKLNVCMTGLIYLNGCKTTKSAYLKKCNELCYVDGVPLIEINITSGKETNPFILYSRASNDSKYLTGESRGVITDSLFGEHPVLMHTDAFYSFLEKVVAKWKQVKEQMSTEKLVLTFQTILKDSMKETLCEIAETTEKMKTMKKFQ